MITIIGAGKFGQTISKLLAKHQHCLVDIEPDGTYSAQTIERIKTAQRIILCVPSEYLPNCITMISRIVPPVPILSCVKGLYDKLTTPTELMRKTLTNPLATFIGPNLSSEIIEGKPAMAVIAGDDAAAWAALFSSERFVTIIEDDCIGNEFAGAVKNIVALAAGIIHGYYGNNSYNAMGSVIALCVRDIGHLYQHKSSQPLPQLSFIGDLFATCMSDTSRNHAFGHQVGLALLNNTQLPKPEQTVEGLRTLHTAMAYIDAHSLPLHTINKLNDILNGTGTVDLLFR